MFTDVIYDTDFCNDLAVECFGNIWQTFYNNNGTDNSFLSTMRALLYNRVDKQQKVNISKMCSKYRNRDIENATHKMVLDAFVPLEFREKGSVIKVHIHSFEDSMEHGGCGAAFAFLDSGFEKELGYSKLEDVEVFFKQKGINARFFINKQFNSAMIFIEEMNLKHWHLLQAFIPVYLPQLFDNAPLEDDETELLRTLTLSNGAQEYCQQLKKIAAKLDMRSIYLHSALDGFASAVDNKSLTHVRDNIESIMRTINSLESQFSQQYMFLADEKNKEAGLLTKLANSNEIENELADFFVCNKGLKLVSVNGSEITFVVKTTLSNYDPDVFTAAINNKRSFFYRGYNDDMTDERVRILMKAVFEDEKLKIKTCAAYKINFETGRYEGCEDFDFDDETLDEYIPNQHIQEYGCLGNNQQVLRDAIMRKDYISAISACCASASNINFADTIVVPCFMAGIFSEWAGKIIQMPDGTSVTPEEAVQWLEEQSKGDEGDE